MAASASPLRAAVTRLPSPPVQVVRVSEELLRVSVLDDAALILLVRGCPLLQELELVQVKGAAARRCPGKQSVNK